MIDLHLSAFAPRWRFLYVVRFDGYITSTLTGAEVIFHVIQMPFSVRKSASRFMQTVLRYSALTRPRVSTSFSE